MEFDKGLFIIFLKTLNLVIRSSERRTIFLLSKILRLFTTLRTTIKETPTKITYTERKEHTQIGHTQNEVETLFYQIHVEIMFVI